MQNWYFQIALSFEETNIDWGFVLIVIIQSY